MLGYRTKTTRIVRITLCTIFLMAILAVSSAAQDWSGSAPGAGQSFRDFLDETRSEREQWRRDSSVARQRYRQEIQPYRDEWLRRSRELSRQIRSAEPHERRRLRNELAEITQRYLSETEEARRRWLDESSTAYERYLDATQPSRDAWLRNAQARYEEMLREYRSRYGEPTAYFPEREEVYSSLLELSARPGNDLVSDQVLNAVYAVYGDGAGLTWDAIQKFQSDLVRSTEYRHEPRALAPNEFYATGGGNCVDYSLATAAFLEHHGIVSYVGGFFAPDESVGHAVVLIPVSDVPRGYRYLELENWKTEDGYAIPDGRYVPVDYEYVGDFSNATAPDAELTKVWRPDDLMTRW